MPTFFVKMAKRKTRKTSRSGQESVRRPPKRFKKRRFKKRSKLVKMFPRKQLCELTYCDEIVVPNRGAGSAPYKFMLNSIYDPDVTATGHQPRGHDQWANIYDKYCVVGCKAIIEPLYGSIINTGTTLFGYVDDDSTTDGFEVADIVELGMPRSKHQYLTIGQDGDRGAVSRRVKKMVFNVGMKKFFGLSKHTQIMNAQAVGLAETAVNPYGLAADFGASPAKGCYLKIHADNQNYAVDTPVVKCRVTLKFICAVYDPKEVAAS